MDFFGLITSFAILQRMNSKLDKIYFKIIQKHFPQITINDITNTFDGNDHWVFVVKDKSFRFPKVSREIDPKRSTFLKRLASLSPIPLPTIELYKDEDAGISYEINDYIPGTSFYPSIAKTFSYNELLGVAKKLGAFLNAVHSFSVDEARKLSLDEMNPNDFWEYMEQNHHAYPEYKRIVFPHVSQDEQVWIEKLFTNYIALIKKKPFQTRVTHSDMWTYHIIVDDKKHTLSGVIDFWGRIADPANDFKAFEYYGKDFVNEVYKSYSLSVDEDFEERRLFYTGHDEVFEFARQLQQRNEEKIIKHKKSLSDYITTHPLID
jgi:aminoglycoside phosphotransferase (APT) family kinase protein